MPLSKRLVVHCRVAPFDVYIGRPSIWGNPFSHLERSAAEFRVGTRTESIEAYEKWLSSFAARTPRAGEEGAAGQGAWLLL